MRVQRRVMASLIGLGLTACAAPPAPPPQHQASESGLPAPTPADVTVHIGIDQFGQTIDVPVGQRFAVELVGVPTAGYVWAPARIPPFLTRAGDASGPTIAAQRQPGFTGGQHWEVLMFAATIPGEGELVLEQRRPWETNEPATSVFRVTIRAR